MEGKNSISSWARMRKILSSRFMLTTCSTEGLLASRNHEIEVVEQIAGDIFTPSRCLIKFPNQLNIRIPDVRGVCDSTYQRHTTKCKINQHDDLEHNTTIENKEAETGFGTTNLHMNKTKHNFEAYTTNQSVVSAESVVEETSFVAEKRKTPIYVILSSTASLEDIGKRKDEAISKPLPLVVTFQRPREELTKENDTKSRDTIQQVLIVPTTMVIGDVHISTHDILEPENCEGNSNDDGLDEGFADEQSKEEVVVTSDKCSIKTPTESNTNGQDGVSDSKCMYAVGEDASKHTNELQHLDSNTMAPKCRKSCLPNLVDNLEANGVTAYHKIGVEYEDANTIKALITSSPVVPINASVLESMNPKPLVTSLFNKGSSECGTRFNYSNEEQPCRQFIWSLKISI